MYLVLAPNDSRIIFVTDTLDYQSNGNYLINGGTLAIPPSICTLVEVDTVPDGVEPERWCYIDGQFTPNPNWVDPSIPDQDAVYEQALEEAVNILKGVVE